VEFVVSASSDHTVRLWNVFTEQFEAELKGHRQAVLALAVLKDGRIASACADGSIRLWGPPTRKDNSGSGGWGWQCQLELQGHSQAVKGLSVLPDDRLVSGAADGHIRLWESRAD
jgi:WD40 repeat protein